MCQTSPIRYRNALLRAFLTFSDIYVRWLPLLNKILVLTAVDSSIESILALAICNKIPLASQPGCPITLAYFPILNFIRRYNWFGVFFQIELDHNYKLKCGVYHTYINDKHMILYNSWQYVLVQDKQSGNSSY